MDFEISVTWTVYDQDTQSIVKPGRLNVTMITGDKNKAPTRKQIVKDQPLNIGRNDTNGYYFKFGIYRVGDSSVPTSWNLADYKEGRDRDEVFSAP